MGCVQSLRGRGDVAECRPGEFCVVNVDESGDGLWPGRLEVGETELVLRRRGREPTRWPLRSLRRYGHDGDIFSFESGRRCATGEGIYAFRCRRAPQLFDALQRSIQSCPPATLDSPVGGRAPRPPPPAPRPPDSPAEPDSPSGADILEVLPLPPQPSANAHVTNLYQLRELPRDRERNNNAKEEARPRPDRGDVNSDLATLRHSLLGRRPTLDDEPDPRTPEPTRYANLDPSADSDGEDGDCREYANLAPADPERVAAETPEPHVAMNYAVLDLDANGDEPPDEAAPPPSSPKRPAVGYTTIDFNKTEALTSVALGAEVDTEGSRRTRHNSTAPPPSPTVA